MWQVVSGLLLIMDDYANPRVQAHAGAALVNFSEDCPKNILALYLDPIIVKLEQVLMAKVKEVCATSLHCLHYCEMSDNKEHRGLICHVGIMAFLFVHMYDVHLLVRSICICVCMYASVL